MDKTKMHDEPNDATGTTAAAPTAPGAAQTPVADVAIPPTTPATSVNPPAP